MNPKYKSDAYRRKMQQMWIQEGKKFLEDGIRNNPDVYDLYFKMGWLLYSKLDDPIGAVPADRPTEPPEVVATILHSLGLNLESHLPGPAGRPYPLVDFGYREISELF